MQPVKLSSSGSYQGNLIVDDDEDDEEEEVSEKKSSKTVEFDYIRIMKETRGLISDRDIDKISDVKTLQEIIKLQKNLIISDSSKARELKQNIEDLRIQSQNALKNATLLQSSQNIRINVDNRRDFTDLNRGNYLSTAARVGSLILAIVMGVISVVCIFI
jgi:hypothetical protein